MSDKYSGDTSTVSSPVKLRRSKRKQATITASESGEWSIEEKQKFVEGLNKGAPIKKDDGNIDWVLLKRHIGSGKTTGQVKDFAKRFNAFENGIMYQEFTTKAAIDVWKQLSENATNPGDNNANICVPQVLTVAALEPLSDSHGSENLPNFNAIYNYLSAVTRGTDVVPLPPNEAVVVLDLLEDLIRTLSKSETLIQREFMHTKYAELRELLAPQVKNENEPNRKKLKCSSTNPFGIPFQVLEFKNEIKDCSGSKKLS